MIERKSLIVIVSCFGWIKFNGFLEFLKSFFKILILKIAQTQVVLSWSVVPNQFTSCLQVFNRLLIVFDLPIAISSMK